MSTGTLTPTPFQTVEGYDSDGLWGPISGCLIYTYMAGTTTPAPTYTDVGLSVANSNPIEADSSGRFVAFLTPGSSYKFAYCLPVVPIPPPSSQPTAFRTQDNIAAVPTSSAAVDITVTWGEVVTAGSLVYESDGSGSKTTGRWYLASSAATYSSSTPAIGFAVTDGTTGSTGAVRQAGIVDGLSGLSPGALYYASTGGAVTATFPTNNFRLVGQAISASMLNVMCIPPTPRQNNAICQGRLTLTTGVAVTTADVTAATTLYWTPYGGNTVSLFDGTYWTARTFTQLSIAVPATTSTMYDVWVYDNGGTISLELLAWTNDTTRATALALQDGVYCQTGALTRRYLGSFRTTGSSGQTEDSFAKRYVWNYYNRMPRICRVLEATATWTYGTATYRQANGAATNQLDIVCGVAEIPLTVDVLAYAYDGTGASLPRVSIGVNATTAASNVMWQTQVTVNNANGAQLAAKLKLYPAVGRSYYTWLEMSGSASNVTWYGTNSATTNWQSGIIGDWVA